MIAAAPLVPGQRTTCVDCAQPMHYRGSGLGCASHAIALRPVLAADLAYCRGAWAEGYKTSPSVNRMSWAVYKRHIVPELGAVLERPDTKLLGAYLGDAIVGWLAYVPGQRVSTVHWVHTRYRIGQDGEPLRRHGVMTQLVDAAQLGRRIVYTHRGGRGRNAERRVTNDEPLVRWLAGRGVSAAYVPYEEWKR